MTRKIWTASPLITAIVVASSMMGGCKQDAPDNEPAKPDIAAVSAMPVAPAVPAAPAVSDGQAREVNIENDLMEFSYAYPSAAAAIPALKDRLDKDLAKLKGELEKDAREAKAEAAKDGFEFHAYSRDMKWQVVANLPRWLSMSSVAGEYTGGAHPNYGFVAKLWDKLAGVERAPVDLFTSKVGLGKALRGKFCAILDAQRAQKRGEKVNRASGSEFDACIDPLAEVLILGSSDKQHFNRIGVLVSPYNAGPYAEGSYEVTLPVTPEILALVKPEYRDSFAVK